MIKKYGLQSLSSIEMRRLARALKLYAEDLEKQEPIRRK